MRHYNSVLAGKKTLNRHEVTLATCTYGIRSYLGGCLDITCPRHQPDAYATDFAKHRAA